MSPPAWFVQSPPEFVPDDVTIPIEDMPGEVPFMQLPNAVLLPNSILPLYIFESKYRRMLADCLASHRMFGIAMIKPGVDQVASADDVHQIAGVGLIRACLGNSDGTSSLVLYGLGRFRITEWDHANPYWCGRIEALESTTDEETDDLECQLLERCRQTGAEGNDIPGPIRHYQAGESDPSLLADVVASAVVSDGCLRQRLLEELNVSKRMRTLLELF